MSADLEVVQSPYVLGIDLGTSTSIVAIYQHGKPKVIKVAGEEVTPSVVGYRDGNQPLIGMPAKRRALIDPDNTVVSIKREMGNAEYKREVLGQPIKPEVVSSLILTYLKSGVQDVLKQNISAAVITVPANFDNNQRQATFEAGRLAGLDVKRIIEEPVAAAIAYGFGSDREQTILVYDLGGGTFDVCILKVITASDGQADFRVLGKAGIPQLGGDDFDNALMRLLAAEIVKSGGPDVLDHKKDQGINKKKLRSACQILKEKAEAAKIELTSAMSAHVDAPSLIKNENGQEFHLSAEITREQFNTEIKPLIEQSAECINQAIREANLTKEDIDRIILVGGSTRVPYVREMVTQMFGKEPYGDIDAATAVAQGAAIIGASYGSAAEKPNVTTITTTSHHLGIETHGQKFSAVLEKNTPVPAENSRTYTTVFDNEPEMRITIFQFPEKAEYIDMKIPGAACLGEFFLGPLPPAPKGTIAVDVKFAIDQNGVLKVSAQLQGHSTMNKELDVRVV